MTQLAPHHTQPLQKQGTGLKPAVTANELTVMSEGTTSEAEGGERLPAGRIWDPFLRAPRKLEYIIEKILLG